MESVCWVVQLSLSRSLAGRLSLHAAVVSAVLQLMRRLTCLVRRTYLGAALVWQTCRVPTCDVPSSSPWCAGLTSVLPLCGRRVECRHFAV